MDIVDIDAGDTRLYAADQHGKLAAETDAVERLFALFALLPARQRDEYLQLWLEFENHGSGEAQFAAVVDGIQPLLNHLLTGQPEDGVIAVDKVRTRKAYIQQHAPALWGLVDDLIRASAARGLYV